MVFSSFVDAVVVVVVVVWLAGSGFCLFLCLFISFLFCFALGFSLSMLLFCFWIVTVCCLFRGKEGMLEAGVHITLFTSVIMLLCIAVKCYMCIMNLSLENFTLL